MVSFTFDCCEWGKKNKQVMLKRWWLMLIDDVCWWIWVLDMDEQTDKWRDKQIDEQTDQWTDEWTDNGIC